MSQVPAHGQHLRILLDKQPERLRQVSTAYPSISLSPRQLCDVELLLNGSFSPQRGFLNQDNYRSVLENGRLSDGTLWPVPICLDVDEQTKGLCEKNGNLLLRDREGHPLAVLDVEDIWQADLETEARHIYGTANPEHPGVAACLARQPYYIGGQLRGIQLPDHFDFVRYRQTPTEIRAKLNVKDWQNTMAFHTSEVMSEQHQTMLREQAEAAGVKILLNPMVGLATVGGVGYAERVNSYRKATSALGEELAYLNLLPNAQQGTGPRETLLQAIVHKNYGCSHMLLGPEHKADTRKHLQAHADELGMTFLTHDQELAAPAPPRHSQGFTLFFTGLSGSGKSTVAKAVFGALQEWNRPMSLLDGDVVRLNLSKGLGFSKQDRDINIERIGYVASEITKCGGIAICAPIAPYARTRHKVREMIEAHGGFIEIHISTSLAACEARDPKGLYAKARAGEIKDFTGIDDPYEIPENPQLRLDTSELAVQESVTRVIDWLLTEGYLTNID